MNTTTKQRTSHTRPEDSRRFPQRRNGVRHQMHGVGVVTMSSHSVGSEHVMVKFDKIQTEMLVLRHELSSYPPRGESPDPQHSRNSGWVGGNRYKATAK